MEDLRQLLQGYHHDGDFWSGLAFVPFWDRELRIWFDTYDPAPTLRQLRILREVLSYRGKLREPFIQALYKFYQENVFGQTGRYHADGILRPNEGVPTISKPDELWQLIPGDELIIDSWHEPGHESAIEFKLRFACSWDEEHGLGVKYRDWMIIDFCGATD